MRTIIQSLRAGGLALVLSVLSLGAGDNFLPLSQVKPGMTGKGRTVLQGTTIAEFDVEVLGVLPNQSPKKSIILARLKGLNLENTGVIMGMSGSPVYLEGKLVGAVAYSFPFSKEPIAGITPIEEMLSISSEAAKPQATLISSASSVRVLTLEDFFDLNRDFFKTGGTMADPQGRMLAPLGVPLVFKGFPSAAMEKSRPILARLGFYPVSAASAPQAKETIITPDSRVREGDPIAVQLVAGDLDMSAVGTVTHVDGDKIYAFGHPLYNLGTVDYAMAKARILTVIPSLQSSFKLASPDILIGKFSQDRSSGTFGEIGKMPKFIPVNIRIQDPTLKKQEFKLMVVNDRILGPFLINQALSALFSSAERSVGDLSLSLEGDVYLEDGRSVHLEDMFAGNFDKPVADLAGLVMSVSYFLLNNDFQEVGVHRLDLNVKVEEQPKVCFLEQALLDKYEPAPNEVMNLKLKFRTYRGESLTQDIPLMAPALPAGSEFQLVVGDAATMSQLEMSLYRNPVIMPRSLAQLIRLLNNLRKNNRIYFKIIASRPGLFLRGEEMPNLPLTMKSLFGSSRSTTSATELSQSTLSDFQLPLEFIFRGSALIPVKIKK
jgi:hypothetical protein